MIPRVRGIFVVVLFLLWYSALPGMAQGGDFIAPPANLILDQSRLLAREPEKLEAISTALAALEEKHGYRLYFVVYDSLFGLGLADRARDLQAEWLGDAAGMVLVLETDSRTFKVAQALPKQEEIEPGKHIEIMAPSGLSAVDLSAIIRTLEERLQAADSAETFCKILGVGMAEGVSGILDERKAVPAGNTRTHMIALAIGLIAVTGLGALLVVAGLKRAEAMALERYVFPKITVATRLGAPYGGGKISSRSFRSPAQEQ